jgi:probable biosynthetic protein (TIGR04098 family)
MTTFYQILKTVLPKLDEELGSVDIGKLSIDSFDLVMARAALERHMGREIPDSAWVRFRTFEEVRRFFEAPAATAQASKSEARSAQRHYEINMPHMTLGGLSENWLFKELGDLHWAMLCEALGRPSDDIVDELGNRLYATFTRIRWESRSHLKRFRENERIYFNNEISRFGKSMFFSRCAVEGEGKSLSAQLMSTFASRQSTNTGLLRGEPRLPEKEKSSMRVSAEMPPFGAEYRDVRRGDKRALTLQGEPARVDDNVLFEMEYRLNPYYDFNGANLLYFAAYPVFHDVCEREYVHRYNVPRGAPGRDWALAASTRARDVFYYGNCDISDSLVLRLHAFDAVGGNAVSAVSSISRKSDGKLLAHNIVIREDHG